MKTQIFKDYSEFLDRIDKKINGVTQEFADQNPNWAEERNNEGCWNCSSCSYCRDCSDCRYCGYCRDCSDCRDCRDCSYCGSCSSCSYCSYCRDCGYCGSCSSCSYCRDKKREGDQSKIFSEKTIPIIENIHQKVLEAVSKPDAFDMSNWHKCETTHCRAGWVEVLAGEAGKHLASITSTPFAAMQIYKVSSKIHVSPVRFYENNETAMRDIIRCAEEEKLSN